MNFEELFSACYLLADEVMNSIQTQFNGVVAIFDIKGFNFSQLRQCTPFRLQLLAQAVQVFEKN